MRTNEFEGSQTLIVSIFSRFCAVPLRWVKEIMRPLPIEPVAGAPSFVPGLSIIRGLTTPVVDLGSVLGTPSGLRGRFVVVRTGDRQVALSVGHVEGIRLLDRATLEKLPPLLGNAAGEIVEAIGTLDTHFLVVLQAGWELPSEVWSAVDQKRAAR